MIVQRRYVGVGLMATVLAACGPTQRPDGGSGLLPEGSMAPGLTSVAHDGQTIELRALGRPTVVYFYPKDGTPGCTKEACAFRDAWDRFEAAGIGVVGVSADSVDAHKAFAAEHNLPFPLVSDAKHEWSRGFGVSTTIGMPERISFLLQPDGKIAKVYPGVDPGVHASEVLADARAL